MSTACWARAWPGGGRALVVGRVGGWARRLGHKAANVAKTYYI